MSLKTLVPLLAIVVFAGFANAITIDYGDFTGNNVMFLDVSEDTRDEPSALFGAPEVVGDTLDFDPLTFTAEVSSTTGTSESEIVDGQLNFTIMGIDDTPITEVFIREKGDYTLTGLGNAQATASVSAPVVFAITHVDGVELPNPINGTDALTFSPDGGSYALPPAVTAAPWTGSLTLDVAAILASEGVLGNATKIEFALDNTLAVAAADGGSAFIAKKDSGVTVGIPEPASMSLLGLGLLMALGIRRK